MPNSTHLCSFFFGISEPGLSLALLCKPSQGGNSLAEKQVGETKTKKKKKIDGRGMGKGTKRRYLL